MREMPASLETSLEEAGKLESIEATQKRLQTVKTSTGALPVAAAVRESETLTPHANALKRGSEIPLNPRVDELTKEVQRLTQELAQLRGEKENKDPRDPSLCEIPTLCAGTAGEEGTYSDIVPNQGISSL